MVQLEGDVFQRGRRAKTSIINDDVQTPQFLDGFVDSGKDGIAIRRIDVHGDGLATILRRNVLGDFFRGVIIKVRDCDGETIVGQALCDSLTNALTSAGDECDLLHHESFRDAASPLIRSSMTSISGVSDQNDTTSEWTLTYPLSVRGKEEPDR